MANRNNPIRETIEHIPGYPNTLIIYKAPFSRFYQARASVGTMVTRSLKTETKSHAIQRAKEFYHELLAKKAKGLPLTESQANFTKAADSLIVEDKARVERGERKPTLIADFTKIYEADLKPFFERDNCKSINYQRIQAYAAHVQQRGVSSATLKQHFVHLRKILKQAHKLDWLDKLPIFPAVAVQDQPREWFNEEQYAALIKAIEKAIKDRATVRYVPITEHLLYLTTFMAKSFLRPHDVKLLKNRDITVIKKPDGTRFLRIMAKGKVAPAMVRTLQAAVEIYERHLKGKPDEFVFFNQYKRSHAMQVMSGQFAYVLKQAKLYEGENGVNRSLYSLRHTCISNALLNRWPIEVVAKNSRTKVDMVERFYASHLRAEMYQLAEPSEPGATLEDFFEE